MSCRKKSLIARARHSLRPLVADGTLSYSSYGSIVDRWLVFVNFLVAREEIPKVEEISKDLVIEFSKSLADTQPSYAQNVISSINTVMKALTDGDWVTVSPVRDCLIARRCNVRTTQPSGMDDHQINKALKQLENAHLSRGRVVALAAKTFGLRVKEATLLDYKQSLQQALSDGYIDIRLGTKGGRPRRIPITAPDEQIPALRSGAKIQGDHFSLIPPDMTWKKFRENEIVKTRAVLKSNGIASIRDLRAAYACQRYQNETGKPAPVMGGRATKEADEKARTIIAEELGHNRTNVTNSYLGKSHAK
ncbi:integrase domain-containing protein [Marinobacter litoralis]|uniref:integrase domain-containing protein n=1 Tax=Marinobacter litoralis TaxID=187981 RepID=UPI0018EE1256|nr:integrase domain-containing protein [Marinobacter litoralis]MBJ6137939.1 integrase domain-containing protein [Marinobacter litoralis]